MLAWKTKWHTEADVVVVGYGAAGAAAAIAAHDAGASVAILEKQEAETPFSNSYMSGGVFICPSDVQAARTYMEALCRASDGAWWTDPDVIRAWAEYTTGNKARLEKMGAEVELHRRGGQHKVPGVESIEVYRFPGMGPGMMRFLYKQIKERNITLMGGVRVNHILVTQRAEVTGVAARREMDHQPVNVKSRRGVVLATGGFEFDQQTKLQFLKVYPFHFYSSPWNTGDGVRMGLEVGAQLWHMNCISGGCLVKIPGVAVAMLPMFGGRHWINPSLSALPNLGGEGWQAKRFAQQSAIGGYIITDRYGKRYTDENYKPHAFGYEMALFDTKRLLYPRNPSHWVFDRRRMDEGPLVAPHMVPDKKAAGPNQADFYKWSADNGEELERGWIKQADTVESLALKLGMEADTLAKTVKDYNLYCENGADVEFSREPHTLVPLNTPPYYAVELWAGGLNTEGGPRRNAKAQVLGSDGTPITHLYSTGELGSVYGMMYPGGGGNLAECFAFGQIAGENAATCRPL